MAACTKHKKNPAWGYSDCAGCEIEQLREENGILRGKLSVYENGTFSTGRVRLSMGRRGLLHIPDFEVEGTVDDEFDVVCIKRPAAKSD